MATTLFRGGPVVTFDGGPAVDALAVSDGRIVHAVWANTAAIRAAGIDADTPEPPLGEIARDADGSPTGMVLEFGGIGLFDGVMPEVDRGMQERGLVEAMRALAAEGIVWAQDASVVPDELDVYLAGSEAGQATCRIHAAFRADPRTAAGLQHFPQRLRDRYGTYDQVGRLTTRLLGRPGVNRRVTRLAARHRTAADACVRLGGNQLREGRWGPAELTYRLARSLALVLPDS